MDTTPATPIPLLLITVKLHFLTFPYSEIVPSCQTNVQVAEPFLSLGFWDAFGFSHLLLAVLLWLPFLSPFAPVSDF